MLELAIPNELAAIATVIECFDKLADDYRIPGPVRAVMDVAFDEMLSNIIHYAYLDDAQHEIQIGVVIDAYQVVATISDDGVPFNPFAQDEHSVSQERAEQEVGGWGIPMVCKMLDEVSYQRTLGRNIIRLVKLVHG